MRVAIRVDASTRIGTGHVMRCLTLAESLCRAGAEVCFLSRRHPGHLMELLRARGFQVADLGEPLPDELLPEGYGRWLGDTEDADAQAVRSALLQRNSGAWDWMVVDHYGLGAPWEVRVRPVARRLLALDDLADRAHACDLLLDQNREAGSGAYASLCSSGCMCLLGPEYALLRKEFLDQRNNLEPRDGEVRTIFVFYGGIDATGETLKALHAIRQTKRSWRVEVVIGSGNPQRGEIEALVAAMPTASLHIGSDRMAALMAHADLALGAGGVSTWERAAVGLPALITRVAENQALVAQRAEALGIARDLGDRESVSADLLAETLESLSGQTGQLQAMGRRALSLVDGRGVERVMARLLATTPQEIL